MIRFSARGIKLNLIVVLGMLSFPLAAQNNDPTDKYFEISKNLEIYANIFKELNQYYVDPIEPGKMVKTSVDAMLNDLDPYTNFITEADAEDYELQTTGKYSGVGIGTNVVKDKLVVSDLIEEGPMAKAGVRIGDIIVSVDGQKITEKNAGSAGMLMRGAPGTTLSVVTRHPLTGAETTRTVTREEIKISSVPFASLEGPDKDIAFVILTQFTPSCSREVRQALDSLKKVQPQLRGVVLDLRSNPGGLLDEAVNLCNLFIDKGQLVVSTRGNNQEWDKAFNTQAAAWDKEIPVAVLINHASASASEIVAGTVQDLDRGVVIGTRSFGKGLVQTVRPLGYNTRLKVTTAKYYTPTGRCIQALDYTHRHEDGSVASVPDSLQKQFKTQGGRTVTDGGGIAPDITIEKDQLSPLAISLLSKGFLFDFATEYYYSHPEIAPPGQFATDDKVFRAFEQWLGDKDYSYQSDSELLLEELRTVAEKEKYLDNLQKELETLSAKLSHDKQQDLQKNQKEIMDLLRNEIINRYYYQRGRIINRLHTEDKDLDKALELMSDKAAYQAVLRPKV